MSSHTAGAVVFDDGIAVDTVVVGGWVAPGARGSTRSALSPNRAFHPLVEPTQVK
jgi:hypothetical protein